MEEFEDININNRKNKKSLQELAPEIYNFINTGYFSMTWFGLELYNAHTHSKQKQRTSTVKFYNKYHGNKQQFKIEELIRLGDICINLSKTLLDKSKDIEKYKNNLDIEDRKKLKIDKIMKFVGNNPEKIDKLLKHLDDFENFNS